MKVVNFHVSAEELARIVARPNPDPGGAISTFGSKDVIKAMKANDPSGKKALELTKKCRQNKGERFVLKTILSQDKLREIIKGMNRSCQERFPGDGFGVIEIETFPGLFEFSELDRAPVSKIAVFVHQGDIFVQNLSVCAYIEAGLMREGINYQISNNPDFPSHIV